MNTRTTHTGTKRWGIALLACGMLLTPAAWADEKLPTADQVLEDYIKATGGREAYEKHTNMRVEGTIEVPMANIKGTLKSTSAAPNLSFNEISMGAMGTQRQGTDGKIVWASDPAKGLRILEGEERDEALREATFNSELLWKKRFKTVECVGIEKVGDQPCHKIIFTRDDGKTVTSFYDQKSKLLLKSIRTASTAMGEIPLETTYEDYKAVDGVTIAHKLIQKIMTMEQRIVFNEIAFNVKLPKDFFAMPEKSETDTKENHAKNGKKKEDATKGDD